MATIRRKIWTYLNAVLPKSEPVDYLISWVKFVYVHHRFPVRNATMFNDVLFRIKSTGEIEDSLRVFVTDKENLKIFVKATVGDKYAVPTIAILRCKAEVDEYIFPENVCIKPTHLSGKVIISKNSCVSKEEIKSWLDIDHYAISRERNYRLLKPKIIVEPVLFDESDLTDFRIFCNNGVAKIICLDIGKYSRYSRAFYSLGWEKYGFSLGYPLYDGDIERPNCLEEMIHVAQKLANGIGFVRVDFYTNGDEFFVGEITNCHASAAQRFIPLSAEQLVSDIIFSKTSNGY